MRNANPLIVGLAALALSGCGSKDQQQNSDQNMALDEGMPNGEVPANADIETLPADESSVTPSNQLQHGIDAPETNQAAENAE